MGTKTEFQLCFRGFFRILETRQKIAYCLKLQIHYVLNKTLSKKRQKDACRRQFVGS